MDGSRRLLPVTLIVASLLPAGAGRSVETPSGGATEATPVVVRLEIEGTINPATVDYIHEGLQTATERKAAALLIQLDTPGGLLESTKLIVKDLLAARVPVIVYVAPSGSGAISAGVFVTLAAHVAAMAPGTNIGAAHPVGAQGETITGDMAQKVENFAVSLSRTIAQQRGRNVEWAEKAVRESVSITEKEALKLKVVDLVAHDVEDLLRQAHGREVKLDGRATVLNVASARVETESMRLRQRIVNFLGNPNIAYLLLMVGILGLYIELTNPGVVAPGIVGAICLLLAFAALQVLPINYTGLALIGLGVALLVAELFLPSFGIIGVGGLIALVLGSLFLFDTPDSMIAVDRGIIAAAAGTVGGFMLIVGWLVVRTQRQRSSVGAEGMVGEIGEVRRAADASGRMKVFVHGEYWDAVADEDVDVGAPVEVVGVRGLQIHVRRYQPAR
jgi:membrane-bound serine protease (ClpP class)